MPDNRIYSCMKLKDDAVKKEYSNARKKSLRNYKYESTYAKCSWKTLKKTQENIFKIKNKTKN